jgi:hypothetical protein
MGNGMDWIFGGLAAIRAGRPALASAWSLEFSGPKYWEFVPGGGGADRSWIENVTSLKATTFAPAIKAFMDVVSSSVTNISQGQGWLVAALS